MFTDAGQGAPGFAKTLVERATRVVSSSWVIDRERVFLREQSPLRVIGPADKLGFPNKSVEVQATSGLDSRQPLGVVGVKCADRAPLSSRWGKTCVGASGN